jgi:hemin uptake protein HemP
MTPPIRQLPDPDPRRAQAPSRPLDGPGAVALPASRLLHSDDLLRGGKTVDILHAGVRYRLSVTALGKLILTK